MKKYLIAFLIVILFVPIIPVHANPGDVEISDGSVKVLYHFDASSLIDSSASGYNGTGAGDVRYSTTSTVPNLGGVQFSTGDNTGNFSFNTLAWNAGSDYSIGFWMKPMASLSANAWFIGKNTAASSTDVLSYSLECTLNHAEVTHHNACKIDVAQTFNTGTWYWVLAVKHGTIIDFYVNNTLTQSATDADITNSSAPMTVNVDAGNTVHALMQMDEIFSTNSAIVTSTRNSLYNSGSGAEICTTVGCANSASGAPSIATSSDISIFQGILTVFRATTIF